MAAAAHLFATRGFAGAGIADIAAEIGMTGAALYRHFDNKRSLLVAVCDRVANSVLDSGIEIARTTKDDHEVLAGMIAAELTLALNERDVLVTYLREMQSLPHEDLRRFRRKQGVYLEEWVLTISGLRSGLSEPDVRALAHAALAVLRSAAQYESGITEERQRRLLKGAAYRVLGVEDPASLSELGKGIRHHH